MCFVDEPVELGLVFFRHVASGVVVSVVGARVVEDGVHEDEEDEARDQVDHLGRGYPHLSAVVAAVAATAASLEGSNNSDSRRSSSAAKENITWKEKMRRS